ncbi:MAG: cupin domain-containing protein [Ignavibacteria bacterium]|nr:cupin domain-containing protein [Ignavibacteria bacterium]
MRDIFENVRKISDLILFQENSIVSKVLFKTNSGNITLFAFWKEQELSPHTSPLDAFVYCVEGEGLIIIDNKEHFLSSGDVILMPANRPHSVKALSNFKILLVMIKNSE